MVAQNPTGATQHVLNYQLFASSGNLTTFTGTTSDSQVLSWTGSQQLNYFSLSTAANKSPSWVSWKDISIYTSGTTRLYPTVIGASNGGDSLLSAVDGDNSTAWNAGTFAGTHTPQYVDLDLRTAQTISHIRLLTNQAPSGTTTHTVYGGPQKTNLAVLKVISGFTTDNQALDIYGSFANIRYLRVETEQSPSWVSWREISVFR